MAKKEIIREEHVLYDGDVVVEFLPESHFYYLKREHGVDLEKKKRLAGSTGYTELLKPKQATDGLMNWAVDEMEKKAIDLMGTNKKAVFSYEDVLSILSSSKNAHTEQKERAAGIGDYVHRFAELYAKLKDRDKAWAGTVADFGEPTDTDEPKITTAIDGLLGWIKEHNVEIEAAEQIIYSQKFGHSGTFDAIVKIDGLRYLCDYKTSNSIYDGYILQAASYLKAYEEGTGDKLDGALVVAVQKEDKERNGEIVKKAGEITTEFVTRQELVEAYKIFKGLIPAKKWLAERSKKWRAANKK